jgi:putative RNA 2'-phosphotransferase
VEPSSGEAATTELGQRYDRSIILKVKAGEMWRAGREFVRSENGVWLTARVEAIYLEFPE